MKKITGFLLSVLLLAIISACGNSGDKAEADNEITLWYWNRGLDESVLEKVKEEFPDIKFNAQKLPPGSEYKTKLSSLLATKNTKDAPDLVLMNIWVSEYLPHADKFLNLYDHGGEEIEKLYPAWKTSQAITGDGEHMIAVPVDTSPTGFFYREDVFSKAGIADSPEELAEKTSTWEGYVDVLTTLKEETGAYAIPSLNSMFSGYINKLDQRFFDENDEFIGDQDHIKDVWDKAIELDEKGLILGNIADQSQEWNAAINNDEIVGYDGPVWAKDILIDTTPGTSGKWKVARSPISDGNDGGSFLAVLSSTKNPEVSAEIAKFINTTENQITSYNNLSLFPAELDALESDKLNNEEEFFGGQNTTEIFVESAKNVKEAHRGPKESIVFSAFSDELDLVKVKKKDPEKAWKDAIEKIKRDIDL
ncbi:carbohydrate ABC transporter substrate-binding protein [Sporosarcina sp. Marseille-Q4063]|uniref:ABC transporter substrate-binding protein n=1 Tax=Sporosarcina sp. Marseille-Q4063 TaxID=2810514 RepID=UPI001BAED612|nr:ABC transporter substrate-binding protein [Sporosarcina sp. Marseille-Q4063]QUW21524.1 carbohydrate ABC transporter substrate-binding protein [Sporosarcina sp. Marseille-Q4063]